MANASAYGVRVLEHRFGAGGGVALVCVGVVRAKAALKRPQSRRFANARVYGERSSSVGVVYVAPTELEISGDAVLQIFRS